MTRRRAYPSDLSDARWALIEPTLTAWRQARTEAGVGGRPPKHDLRELFNAILYVNRTGIPWRYLPHDFPPHETVYGHFAAWRREGVFTRLNVDLTGLARTTSGRAPEPTACILDTQSVKTSTNAPLTDQGIDAGKRIVGRKRGVVTDTLGLLLDVIVTAAGVSDNPLHSAGHVGSGDVAGESAATARDSFASRAFPCVGQSGRSRECAWGRELRSWVGAVLPPALRHGRLFA